MNELKKKNNKGFSLVELIVVVLIIGILGVSLAPNIMKWVGKARDNQETRNQESLKSTMQLAVTDFLAEGGKFVDSDTDDYILTITAATTGYTAKLMKGSTETDMLADDMTSISGLAKSIYEVFGDEYLIPTETDKNTYTITINAVTGQVTIAVS